MKLKLFFLDLLDLKILAGFLIMITLILALFFLLFSKVEDFKTKYKYKFFAYLLFLALTSLIVIFIGSSEVFQNELRNVYSFYQIIFLIFGTIHCLVFRHFFEKFRNDKVWFELVFAFACMFFMAVPSMFMFTVIKGNKFTYDALFSLLCFPLSTLVYLVFEASTVVPPRIYETWCIPEEANYADPTEDEYEDMLVITFVFYKNAQAREHTVFRAKAPIRMNFDRLFYHFIHDYNFKNPDDPILILDENGVNQHWVFFLKSGWLGRRKVLVPKMPLYVNNLHENSVVICERVQRSEREEEFIHRSRGSKQQKKTEE